MQSKTRETVAAILFIVGIFSLIIIGIYGRTLSYPFWYLTGENYRTAIPIILAINTTLFMLLLVPFILYFITPRSSNYMPKFKPRLWQKAIYIVFFVAITFLLVDKGIVETYQAMHETPTWISSTTNECIVASHYQKKVGTVYSITLGPNTYDTNRHTLELLQAHEYDEMLPFGAFAQDYSCKPGTQFLVFYSMNAIISARILSK